MSNSKTKHAHETRDYTWDLSEDIKSGDSIATRSFEVIPADGLLTFANITNGATSVTARVGGGKAGTAYQVICHVVTANGEILHSPGPEGGTIQITP